MVLRLPDRERSRVVLIGTARHGRQRAPQPDLPNVPAVRHGLTAIADTFADRRLCGIAPTNIRIVLDPPDAEQACADLVQAAGYATDLLLVHLAGCLVAGEDGEPGLALAGTRRAALPLAQVGRLLATSRATVRVLVVDGLLAGADPERVRARCAGLAETTALVALAGTRDGYAPPGRPGTALVRVVLDLAYRRDDGRPGMLRTVDLADALARDLGDRFWYAEPAYPPRMALFRNPAGLAPIPADLRRLARQDEVAADAERLSHRPALIADRYRALALTAHRVHGAEHPETLRLRHRLAHWTGKSGDVATAVALYTELHADRERLLGASHPHTRGSAADLHYWAGA